MAASPTTTPTPTHVSAILGMERAIAALVDACDRGSDVEVMGRALARCRAALAAWEQRPRLVDDGDLVADVKYWGPPGTREADAKAILHAIEAHLYGKERT